MLGGSIADIAAASQQSAVPKGDAVYLLLSRAGGAVEIWLIDGMNTKPLFWSMGFVKGETLVTQETKWSGGGAAASAVADDVGGGAKEGGTRANLSTLYVQELGVYRTEERGVPILFCITSQNDVFVYKSIYTSADDTVLPLRFHRVRVDFVTRSYADVSAAPAATREAPSQVKY